MKTISDIYKIGSGPSSSHTMAPEYASKEFLRRYPNLKYVKAILYGSLALTGKGHLTDYIIKKTFDGIKVDVIFDIDIVKIHPNTMEFYGVDDLNHEYFLRAISIGGGDVLYEDEEIKNIDIYPHNSFEEIKKYCIDNNLDLAGYVDHFEKVDSHLNKVYDAMLKSIERGLNEEGLLPGELRIKRKAKELYPHDKKDNYRRRKVIAYSYAVAEENASGGIIVTAPTCGSAGVLPAILKISLDSKKYTKKELINGLKVAGLMGNLIRTNASISGAVAGCSAEVGSACCMAAAFLAYINKMDIDIIQRSSEIALEHHLGLTCDPVKGYVQIPCIERNAVAALRAMDSYLIASELKSKEAKISFDLICKTMLKTGKDLSSRYRETSKGGLALDYNDNKNE